MSDDRTIVDGIWSDCFGNKEKQGEGYLRVGSILQSPSFELSVSMGLVEGFSVVDKYGENPDVDTGSTSEDLWEFGGLYNYDADGTAPIKYLSCSNSADTGQTIEVQGLGIDGSLVTQDATTNGQANVELTTPLWRVFRMQNNSNTGLDLVGTLYCHTDDTPSGGVPDNASVRAIIDNGNNQTLMSLYTVPKGKVAFLYRGEFGISRNQTSGSAEASYRSRRFGKLFKTKKRVDITNQGASVYQDSRSFPDIIPALTDIKLTIEGVSANNSGFFGTFDLLLVDENKFSDEYLQAIGQPGY